MRLPKRQVRIQLGLLASGLITNYDYIAAKPAAEFLVLEYRFRTI
jgi:hypothetical protein